jgi:hypothetical protein
MPEIPSRCSQRDINIAMGRGQVSSIGSASSGGTRYTLTSLTDYFRRAGISLEAADNVAITCLAKILEYSKISQQEFNDIL